MNNYGEFLIEANLIDGKWVAADNQSTLPVTNPATGEILGHVPDSGESETNRAIKAASAAFEGFSRSDLNQRVALLQKLHDALLDNREPLAQLLTAEQGKPLFESRGEIAIGAAYVRWFAEEIRRCKGEVIPAPTNDRCLLVTHRPVGVIAAITPWNFPSSMLARKLAPALAAGCTIVAKPAAVTPYSGLAWGKLVEEVGFPPGVVNVITGNARQIGSAIMANPAVRKITFTGSTEVGKELIRQSADTVKKVSMELGGNAPFLVFADADLDSAVEGAMIAKYRNMGQTCVGVNRFFVQEDVHDAFVNRLSEATAALKVGDGAHPDVQQGPLIDQRAVQKLEMMIEDAIAKGAEIVVGGNRHSNGGTFFCPTVITGVTSNMLIATDEIFGPIAAVFRFETEQEAITKSNATRFGLAAYAYTRDLARAFRLNGALEYGLIGINSGMITTVEAPFGGLKESGIGKEGGSQGLEDYLESKYMCVAGIGLPPV